MKLQEIKLVEFENDAQPADDMQGNISGETNKVGSGVIGNRNLALKIFRKYFKQDIISSKEIGPFKAKRITDTILANINDAIKKTEKGSEEERQEEFAKVIKMMKTFVEDQKGGKKLSAISEQERALLRLAYDETLDSSILRTHVNVLEDIQKERSKKGNTVKKRGAER